MNSDNVRPPVEIPDVKTAVYDFILKYALPSLAPANIFEGWQNNTTLPKTDNEYAIFTILREERKGVNATNFIRNEDSGTLSLLKYILCDVQLDFCSDTDDARKRATIIETVARSAVGVDFFKPYGISCLYADDPKGVEYVDGTDRYVKRWITTLHLGYAVAVPIETPFFSSVKIKRMENIDIHHPDNR